MGLIAAVGTAVTAVAASVGVAVTATALTVGFTTIAAVGAVVGAVGAVTHNKVLSMVGLGLGAVGGIGALAAGAGLLGSGAGLNLGEGASAGAAGADAASAGTIDSVAGASGLGGAASAEEMLGLPAAGSVEAGGAGASSIGLGDIAKGLGVGKQGVSLFSTDSEPANPTDVAALSKPPTGADALNAAELTKIQGGFLNTSPSVAGATTPAPTTTPLVPPPPAPGTSAAPGTSGGFNNGQDLIGPNGSVTVPPVPPGGALKGLLDFANDNPVVAFGALQAGGSLLSGLTSTLTPAQVAALTSQSAANDAATALVKQQQQNLAAPKSVASSVPVTGQAQLVPTPLRPTTPPQTTPTGFINQNPVSSAPVTGVAA